MDRTPALRCFGIVLAAWLALAPAAGAAPLTAPPTACEEGAGGCCDPEPAPCAEACCASLPADVAVPAPAVGEPAVGACLLSPHPHAPGPAGNPGLAVAGTSSPPPRPLHVLLSRRNC